MDKEGSQMEGKQYVYADVYEWHLSIFRFVFLFLCGCRTFSGKISNAADVMGNDWISCWGIYQRPHDALSA